MYNWAEMICHDEFNVNQIIICLKEFIFPCNFQIMYNRAKKE